MLLWLIFLTLSSYSQTIEKFCFRSESKKSSVIKSLTPLLLPADNISQEDKCFSLSTVSHRRELLQRYILNQDPTARISFSSEEIRKDPCQLKVEKIKVLSAKNTQASLNGAQATETKSQGKETSRIQTLGEFALGLNQNVIEGHCRYITPSRYEIKLNVRKDPKPLYPPASPGVIIIINGAPPPPQETSNLQTTVQLQRGERIHIGSVVQDQKEDKKQIDIKPKIEIGKSQTKGSEEIYLSID
jgi:hypothetical protein